MSALPDSKLCQILFDELYRTACAMNREGWTPEEFTQELLRMEKLKVSPAGFTLLVTNTLDEWTHLSLTKNRCPKIAASFDFFPQSGAFRRIQTCVERRERTEAL